jgi:hypothetical protein
MITRYLNFAPALVVVWRLPSRFLLSFFYHLISPNF